MNQNQSKKIIYILSGIALLAVIITSLVLINNSFRDRNYNTNQTQNTTQNPDADNESNDENKSDDDSISDQEDKPDSPKTDEDNTDPPQNQNPQTTSLDSKVELLFESGFGKEVIDDKLPCGDENSTFNPSIKKTRYTGRTSWMTVINASNLGIYSKEDINAFNSVLASSTLDSQLHTKSTNNLMNKSCSGFGVVPLLELDMKGYEFVNVDRARAYLVLTGQSINYSPNILVYADRGGSLIQIFYQIRSGNELTNYEKAGNDICSSKTTGDEIFNCAKSIATSTENVQLAYVSLNKIVTDYQLKGPKSKEEVSSVSQVSEGMQTLTLTLSSYFENETLSGAIFKDSAGKIYIMKNNSDLNNNVRKIINSGASPERVYNAKFVITAEVKNNIEILNINNIKTQINYELSRLVRYTFSY
jgi:hypothetical protein